MFIHRYSDLFIGQKVENLSESLTKELLLGDGMDLELHVRRLEPRSVGVQRGHEVVSAKWHAPDDELVEDVV